MNISPSEAEEALAAIQTMTQKTRRSIASGSAYISHIITGVVWLIGFTATQFLTAPLIVWIWVVTSIVGSAFATFMGIRTGKRVRIASSAVTGKRIAIFWLLLTFFAAAIIAVAHPTDGKQITLLIILLAMIGQMGMGLRQDHEQGRDCICLCQRSSRDLALGGEGWGRSGRGDWAVRFPESGQ